MLQLLSLMAQDGFKHFETDSGMQLDAPGMAVLRF